MTMLTPEDFGEGRGTPMMLTSVAGLQFYDYATRDDLIGDVIPGFGDRVQLVREPRNIHDEHAIQVMWRDGRIMLGHLSREVAADLAPVIDSGVLLRGYVLAGGDGSAWSAVIAICGDAIPRKWRRHSMRWRRRFWIIQEASEAASRKKAEDDRQSIRRAAIKADEIARRNRRRADAAHALAKVVVAGDDVPPARLPLPRAPTEAEAGRCFGWWDDIPTDDAGPIFRTKTQWSEAGYRVVTGAEPCARIEYGQWRRRRDYPLFAAHQVVPKRVPTPAQMAAAYARDIR